MSNPGPGKTSLFLMELLVSLAVFALAAALCVQCFVYAHLSAEETGQLDQAVILAENGAELIRAGGLDLAQATLGGGRPSHEELRCWYDESWQACGEAEASYTLSLTLVAAGPWLDEGASRVYHSHSGEEIFSLPVARPGGERP